MVRTLVPGDIYHAWHFTGHLTSSTKFISVDVSVVTVGWIFSFSSFIVVFFLLCLCCCLLLFIFFPQLLLCLLLRELLLLYLRHPALFLFFFLFCFITFSSSSPSLSSVSNSFYLPLFSSTSSSFSTSSSSSFSFSFPYLPSSSPDSSFSSVFCLLLPSILLLFFRINLLFNFFLIFLPQQKLISLLIYMLVKTFMSL